MILIPKHSPFSAEHPADHQADDPVQLCRGSCQWHAGSLSSRARAVQAHTPEPERSVPGGELPSGLASTFLTRRFQSAIRALGIKFQAQEIKYGGIDAHSAWRAQTTVEVMAQKRRRAADPVVPLRGNCLF